MISFETKQEAFAGPLGLLLELLDKHELEIKDVNLAQVTDEYLERLAKETVLPEEMADFLVIASRLIYLKSRELLPYLRIDDEEEKVEDLEDQLRLYRLFVDAADRLEAQFLKPTKSYLRPYSKSIIEADGGFYPAENINIINLHQAFRSLLKRMEPFLALQEVSMQRVKSIEERLDELKTALTARAKMSFKDIVAGAKSRVEVVVSFLALLELMRRQIVKVKQKDKEIIIERV
ncbi:segregation/condensation protein A [Patescibacteria group bacterium]|nr:segregation/condensation protein A [Patescibacteria group bacterium]MBU4453207.1 segregation/condensation protein A [Patescibacteria group bacterium]MCG2687608.1 segregation/condensation protein A [Candidatus Parcubacteria bacterium]